jgi:single-stranded-DNA-specific exonuclease
MRHGRVRPGIAALARVAGVAPETLTSESLSFALAPRLNAAGRLDDARVAFDLLTTESEDEARDLAEQLQGLNVRRQEQTETWVAEAMADLERRSPRGVALVVGGYPLGIAGIVAARLAEEVQLPAIVLNESDGVLRGSARAPEPFNVVDGLRAAAPFLDRFGGHARAAGLTASSDRLSAIRRAIEEHFEPLVPEGERRPALYVDGLVRPETVGWDTAVALESLEPHGEGNPPALLLWKDVEVLGHRIVGQGHLSMTVRAGTRVTSAIAFRPRLDPPPAGSRIDLVFELRREFWNDSWRVAVRARDWRPA